AKIMTPPDIRIGNAAEIKTRTARGGIDCPRKGIGNLELQTMGRLAVEFQLQRVVVRIYLVRGQTDRLEAGIWKQRVIGPGRASRDTWQQTRVGQVDIAIVVLMPVLIAHIGDGEDSCSPQDLLNTCAVLVADR